MKLEAAKILYMDHFFRIPYEARYGEKSLAAYRGFIKAIKTELDIVLTAD